MKDNFKKNTIRKVTAVLIVLCMVAALMPDVAYAGDGGKINNIEINFEMMDYESAGKNAGDYTPGFTLFINGDKVETGNGGIDISYNLRDESGEELEDDYVIESGKYYFIHIIINSSDMSFDVLEDGRYNGKIIANGDEVTGRGTGEMLEIDVKSDVPVMEEVSDYARLKELLETPHEVFTASQNGEEVDWNLPNQEFYIVKDMTVPGGDEIGTFVSFSSIIVNPGVTFTLDTGSKMDCELYNFGRVVVKNGAVLGTTQGGTIINYGKITVDEGGVLESVMGGNIQNIYDSEENDVEAEIEINGEFKALCGGAGKFANKNGAVISGTGTIIKNLMLKEDDSYSDNERFRVKLNGSRITGDIYLDSFELGSIPYVAVNYREPKAGEKLGDWGFSIEALVSNGGVIEETDDGLTSSIKSLLSSDKVEELAMSYSDSKGNNLTGEEILMPGETYHVLFGIRLKDYSFNYYEYIEDKENSKPFFAGFLTLNGNYYPHSDMIYGYFVDDEQERDIDGISIEFDVTVPASQGTTGGEIGTGTGGGTGTGTGAGAGTGNLPVQKPVVSGGGAVYGASAQNQPGTDSKVTDNEVVKPSAVKVEKITAGKKKLTVKWKKAAKNTDGYLIQYSMKKNFKGSKTVKIAGGSKSSATIKSLKSRKKYYVRICAYRNVNGKQYRSAWSKARGVKVR